MRRIVAIWRECRDQFGAGGAFLFGAFSAADAMYAPVASRFRTYIPDLGAYGDDGTAAAYVAACSRTRPCRTGRPGPRRSWAGKQPRRKFWLRHY